MFTLLATIVATICLLCFNIFSKLSEAYSNASIFFAIAYIVLLIQIIFEFNLENAIFKIHEENISQTDLLDDIKTIISINRKKKFKIKKVDKTEEEKTSEEEF